MANLPSFNNLSDQQSILVPGPDGATSTYQYDSQTRSLQRADCSVAVSCKHGVTHIGDDPIPGATCSSPGLMSADDKCKLDAFTGTRIGVLGFMGAGMPDDGGFLEGDIILAAGSDFITLERVGNIIRWNVEIPVPLRCDCFTPGARVRMADGTTKAIEDIERDDYVITHKGNIKRVLKTMSHHHNGDIKYWKADKHSGENFGLTMNHPVYAIQREHAFFESGKVRPAVKEAPSWIESKEIGPGDLVVRRHSHNIVEDIQTIDVLDHLDESVVEKDGMIYPVRPDNQTIDDLAIGCPRFIPVDHNFLTFLGYYAAEGSADIKNGVRINVHSEEMIAEDIGGHSIRLISELFGIEPGINDKSNTPNGKEIRFNCVPLVKLFSSWFGKKNNKKFPEWITKLPFNKQKKILIGLIRGDGYISKHRSGNIRFELGMGSRNLVDQSLLMAERCGWEPSNPQPRVNKDGFVKYMMIVASSAAPELCDAFGLPRVEKKLSRERKSNGEILRRISEESVRHYNGMVYNFEVSGDNSYIVDGIVVHNCDECAELFLVQDSTDVDKVRPSNCAGRIPGLNVYNEFSSYLVPRSAAINTADIDAILGQKDQYPAMIFKRFNDQPGLAEFQLILKRTSSTGPTAEVGWTFTPGTSGVVTNVFAMGRDDSGNLMRFSFIPEKEPGLLGGLFYQGNLITKKMAVIVGYEETVIEDNRYTLREWDMVSSMAKKDSFTARNVWEYQNPENQISGTNPQRLQLDSQSQLLPIGSLVELWAFTIGASGTGSAIRYFFSKRPELDPRSIWVTLDCVQFGSELISRDESVGGTAGIQPSVMVSDLRNFEKYNWGLNGYDDPLIYNTVDATNITGGGFDVNADSRVRIDTVRPGLIVDGPAGDTSAFPVRPIHLWYRSGQRDSYFRALVGRPENSDYTPIDLLFRAPIDSWETRYAFVTDVDQVGDIGVVSVCGVNFTDIPPFGTLRNLTPGDRREFSFNYSRKIVTMQGSATGGFGCNQISLIGYEGEPQPNIEPGDVLELVHQDYDSPCLRIDWEVEPASNIQRVRFRTGNLNTGLPYSDDIGSPKDDFVRGLNPGYVTSAVYSQAGFWTGIGSKPQTSLDEFSIYDGGAVLGGAVDEFWNELEVMIRDNQLWIWWNKLLIPPDPTANSALPQPVTIDTPYYPVNSGKGKLGLRMFPGTRVREVEIQGQTRLFNEFTNGNIKIV